jgi:Protein of unknown function (DUF2281)
MKEQLILTQLYKLPENLKQEVLDFMDFLVVKHQLSDKKNRTPKFGSAKGKYTLAPDFDAPLDDFKEYM